MLNSPEYLQKKNLISDFLSKDKSNVDTTDSETPLKPIKADVKNTVFVRLFKTKETTKWFIYLNFTILIKIYFSFYNV